MVTERPLEALEVDFRQSFAMWPPGRFWVGVCMERGGEWKLVAGEASPSGYFSMHAPRVRDSGRAPEAEAEAEVACH